MLDLCTILQWPFVFCPLVIDSQRSFCNSSWCTCSVSMTFNFCLCPETILFVYIFILPLLQGSQVGIHGLLTIFFNPFGNCDGQVRLIWWLAKGHLVSFMAEWRFEFWCLSSALTAMPHLALELILRCLTCQGLLTSFC